MVIFERETHISANAFSEDPCKNKQKNVFTMFHVRNEKEVYSEKRMCIDR